MATAMSNNGSLADFTSGEGVHVLGGYPSGGAGSNLFDGATRNVKIYDTYVPEPGGLVLVLSLAAGLLLCTFRRRRR